MKLGDKLELLTRFDQRVIGNFSIGSFICIGCFEIKGLDTLESHHIIPMYRLEQRFNLEEKIKSLEYFLPFCSKCHRKIHKDLTKCHRFGSFQKITRRTLEWLNE